MGRGAGGAGGWVSRARQWASSRSSSVPLRCARCHSAKSAYWSGGPGSGSAAPLWNAAYSRPSSSMTICFDIPSKTRWWAVKTAVCSVGEWDRTSTRSTGPVTGSSGARTSCAHSASPWSGSSETSTNRRVCVGSGETYWTGSPARSPNVVRSASWRSATAVSARAKASRSSGPDSRHCQASL